VESQVVFENEKSFPACNYQWQSTRVIYGNKNTAAEKTAQKRSLSFASVLFRRYCFTMNYLTAGFELPNNYNIF
jgi:hypothetical protein